MQNSVVLTPEKKKPRNCKVDVLSVMPHPDDAEMICGGLLLKAAESHMSTAAVELTRGESGTRGTVVERLAELKSAAKVLKLKRREVFDFGDGSLDDTPEIVDQVASVIRFYQPEILVTTHWEGNHPDHLACWRICKKAVWRANMGKFKDGLKRHKAAVLLGGQNRLGIKADFVLDICSVINAKMKAIKCHKSQLYQPNKKLPKTQIGSKDFLLLLDSINRFYGFQAGCEFGEPFAVEGPLLIKNLKGLI